MLAQGVQVEEFEVRSELTKTMVSKTVVVSLTTESNTMSPLKKAKLFGGVIIAAESVLRL